jgi:hypothetical protein
VAISIAPTKTGIVAGLTEHDRQRALTAKLEDRDGVSRHERQFPRDVRLLFVWILRVAFLVYRRGEADRVLVAAAA